MIQDDLQILIQVNKINKNRGNDIRIGKRKSKIKIQKQNIINPQSSDKGEHTLGSEIYKCNLIF